jgi:2-polyprenyl-3-methyl-5-hydroxy-6-metoxy-1,4-benzoquinol methylase
MSRVTDKEFFDIEVAAGITPENPDYYNLMDATANIISEYARTVIEIGAGMGTLGECLQKKRINYYGIEPNKYHQDYAYQRGVKLNDITDYPDNCQMVVSIEVMEHLTDEQIKDYMSNINCEYFLFSSTPYYTTPEQDEAWGHINIKSEEKWIEFFSQFGFSLEKKLTLPTEWSLLFRK